MTAEVILVLHQMFTQKILYENGVMTCRNQQNGHDFGKTLSKVTAKYFEDAAKNTEHITNNNVQQVVKSITTKCKSLGHTAEAAKDA